MSFAAALDILSLIPTGVELVDEDVVQQICGLVSILGEKV